VLVRAVRPRNWFACACAAEQSAVLLSHDETLPACCYAIWLLSCSCRTGVLRQQQFMYKQLGRQAACAVCCSWLCLWQQDLCIFYWIWWHAGQPLGLCLIIMLPIKP
jgi:hypothetical protein